MPFPKNVSTRWRVRSKNWSGIDEFQRLMLFLQRPHGGNRNDPLGAQLLKSVNIGAKIQLAGENAVSPPVARQECNFAAFERPQDVGIRRLAERRLEAHLFNFSEAGHRVQPAPAYDPDFRLRQSSPQGFEYRLTKW